MCAAAICNNVVISGDIHLQSRKWQDNVHCTVQDLGLFGDVEGLWHIYVYSQKWLVRPFIQVTNEMGRAIISCWSSDYQNASELDIIGTLKSLC